jgi:glutamine amidotransferase PdxT
VRGALTILARAGPTHCVLASPRDSAERNDLGPIQSRSTEMKVNGNPLDITIRYVFMRGPVIREQGEYRVETTPA